MKMRFPQIIEHRISMKEPNSPVKIFSGEYFLVTDEKELKVTGEIKFEWFPSLSTKFNGTLEPDEGLSEVYNQGPFKIKIDGNLLEVEAVILSGQFGEGLNLISGVIHHFYMGDVNLAVDKVRFILPNFRNFVGSPVQKEIPGEFKFCKNRLILKKDQYVLTLDKRHDFKDLEKTLKGNGGYLPLYYGELEKRGGRIVLSELKETLSCLSFFLSFLNGKRTSILFLDGIAGGECVWTDYTSRKIDPHKDVLSWPVYCYHHVSGIENLWREFSLLWANRNDKNFLENAITWYSESNYHSGLSDASIIIGQVALELIYNWWLIERRNVIRGNDANSLNAANKIRLLLAELNIPYSVPAELKNLIEFGRDHRAPDGPDVIVQIRNSIVHSSNRNRKKNMEANSLVKFDASQLCIYYVELCLLKILGFEGEYRNRFSYTNELVPWSKGVGESNPNRLS